jgi:hypothetical protein
LQACAEVVSSHLNTAIITNHCREIFEIVDVPKLQRHNHIWIFSPGHSTAKRGRTAEPQELTRKYTSKQKISAAKKKDLVSLCRSGIM